MTWKKQFRRKVSFILLQLNQEMIVNVEEVEETNFVVADSLFENQIYYC